MEVLSRKQLEDHSFKNNSSVDFLEFRAVSYDTVNQNLLDGLLRLKLLDKAELYGDKISCNEKIINAEIDIMNSYADLGLVDSVKLKRKELENLIGETRVYSDSLICILRQDSIIEKNIENRINPDTYFRCKLYAKMTFTDNLEGNRSYNVMDTMYMFFDKNFNPYDLPDQRF